MKLKLFLWGLLVVPIYVIRLFLELFVSDKANKIKDMENFDFSKAYRDKEGPIIIEAASDKEAAKLMLQFLDYNLAEGAVYRYKNGLMDSKERERLLQRKGVPENIKRKIRKEFSHV